MIDSIDSFNSDFLGCLLFVNQSRFVYDPDHHSNAVLAVILPSLIPRIQVSKGVENLQV